MARKINTLESHMILNGKKGVVFYTHKGDNYVTALSTHYGRKVQTERVVIVEGTLLRPSSKSLLKVTLL
jgi:hypothetical protein